MTDFASQGKTRPWNPVHLNNCRTHQAYYTALSRSASAHGTIILQGFDSRKITGKASGALRQELRDLELLDEITRLRYESKLHKTVTGETRNSLVHTFRMHKGTNYVPATVHQSIRWSQTDPMLDPINHDMAGKVIAHARNKQKEAEVDNIQLTKKRKYEDEDGTESIEHKRKISKTTKEQILSPLKCKQVASKPLTRQKPLNDNQQGKVPLGVKWNENSCAYDATITVIHSLWGDNPSQWSHRFDIMNKELLGMMGEQFKTVATNTEKLEMIRDKL